MFPIYIPSKGRADTCTTPRLLLDFEIEFTLVVGRSCYNSYLKKFGARVMCQPPDFPKQYGARNFCKHHSSELGHDAHWQLDDDIKSFIRRAPGRKCEHVNPAVALEEMEQYFRRYQNVGMVGTNQNSFPPGEREVHLNKLPVQAFLVNNNVAVSYRDIAYEDFDFALSVLSEGWCTAMFDHLRTNTPPCGSRPGGAFEDYRNQELQRRSMEEIVKRFPVMTIEETPTGPRIKRNRIFSTFTQRPLIRRLY